MLRPNDSHATRVIAADLALTPPGETRWTYDAYSNSICHFTPAGASDVLQVISTLLIERYPKPLRNAELAAPLAPTRAIGGAVFYAHDDAIVLAPLIRPYYLDDDTHQAWLGAQRVERDDTALDRLLRLTRAIHDTFSYGVREEYGTLSPAETILRGGGTCRDFAWLMIESVRRWGFAARFVTGYLYSPPFDSTARGAGATHAWCEVFVPDLGWIEFDPTNGLSESPDLIRVAATRTPGEASPVSGVVLGPVQSTLEAKVFVELADA